MPGPGKVATKQHSRAHRTMPGKDPRGLIELPPECDLPVPELPAGRAWSAWEGATWAAIWSGPTGVMYDDAHAPLIASYVVFASRVYADPACPAWVAAEQRQLSDKLGLSPAGLAALGWVFSS